MKILHVISQTPDFTGSGKYIQAILKGSSEKGHDNFLVAGVQDNELQGDFSLNSEIIDPEKTMFVRFGSVEFHEMKFENPDFKDVYLDYPLPGMSDVMPYKSTIFSTLTPSQVNDYEEAFKRVIKKAAKEFRPDIIHTHHLWIVSAVTREILPDIPMVTTCHGTCLRQFSLCEDIGRRISPAIKKIDRIMALSNYQKQEIMRIHNIPPDKIDVVGGGYDENLFCFAKKSAPPPVEILYAGKLSYSKGVPWLLKSLRQVANNPSLQQHTDTESFLETASSPLWHLHLAGGGSGCEKDECLELANELESASKVRSNSDIKNRVTVYGALTHKELAVLMKKAHLFILPSFFEGLPLVVLEALACGCRVITTSLPGTCEVLGSCDSLLLGSTYKSGDSVLSKNSNNNMVTLVELPELETVDKPYNKDLNHLEAILSNHIATSIEQLLENHEPDQDTAHRLTVNYTWERVFERIEKVYYHQIQK